MTPKEQIDIAIAAHGLWKARLKSAIDTGTSEFVPSVVLTDNSCDLGKWLHGEIAPQLKTGPTYKAAVQCHARFHREAGRILQLALGGKKAEAEAAMGAKSAFAELSGALTASMIEWKRGLP